MKTCQTHMYLTEQRKIKLKHQRVSNSHNFRNKCRGFHTRCYWVWIWNSNPESLKFISKVEQQSLLLWERENTGRFAHLADTSLLPLWTSDCTCCIAHSWGGSAYPPPGEKNVHKIDLTSQEGEDQWRLQTSVKQHCNLQEMNPVLYLLHFFFLQRLLVWEAVSSPPICWEQLSLPSGGTMALGGC